MMCGRMSPVGAPHLFNPAAVSGIMRKNNAAFAGF
jgi:hypothetical protein